MATTANMNLTKWPNGADLFSHVMLSSDWDKVDAHDHTSTKGVPIPTGGLANLAVTTAKLAASSVTKVKLGADVDYESAFSSWKHVFGGYGLIASGWTGTLQTVQLYPFYLKASEFTAGARTTSLFLRLSLFANAVSTGALTTVTGGLHALTAVAGSSGLVTTTYNGTAVSGSTTPAVVLATSSPLQDVSGEFAVPANGWYNLAVKGNATAAANSAVGYRMDLMVHQT